MKKKRSCLLSITVGESSEQAEGGTWQPLVVTHVFSSYLELSHDNINATYS